MAYSGLGKERNRTAHLAIAILDRFSNPGIRDWEISNPYAHLQLRHATARRRCNSRVTSDSGYMLWSPAVYGRACYSVASVVCRSSVRNVLWL